MLKVMPFPQCPFCLQYNPSAQNHCTTYSKTKPTQWLLVQDLELVYWSWVRCLVTIGQEPRVDAVYQFDARLCKSRLRDGVVFRQEVKLNYIPGFCSEAVGGENQPS